MKAIVTTEFETSQNWKNRIVKMLSKKISHLHVSECGMRRGNGYGQYYYTCTARINNELKTIEKHHTSSQEWDFFEDLEPNTGKLRLAQQRIAFNLLRNYIDNNY